MIMIIRDQHGQVQGMVNLPERHGLRASRTETEIRGGLRGVGWTMAPPEDRTSDILTGACAR